MDEDAGKVVARVHKGAHKTNSQKTDISTKGIHHTYVLNLKVSIFLYLVKYVILVNYRFNIKMYS